MNKTKKATRVSYHILWQIVHQIPRWLIEKLVNKHGIDARKFSETSHVAMLLLGHLIHARCMTEICDNASMNRRKLFLVRRATHAPRNTFSHANRTRDASLAEDLYWETLDALRKRSPGFAPIDPKPGGFLSRFRNRTISAADSTVISLALNCMSSFPYRKQKAAAKAHMRLNIEAMVEVDGRKRSMVFITNNLAWSARTICELYKARWTIKSFFKELKQTLQLSDFIGTNENAVKWQRSAGHIHKL